MEEMGEEMNDESGMAAALKELGTDKLLQLLEAYKVELPLLARRFWQHVDHENRPEPLPCRGYGPCLLWTAGADKGYAVMWVWGRMKRASHVAWFLANLVWPEYLCHVCDNPLCVAVEHLSMETPPLTHMTG
jgi:hypothetical protein